MSSSCCSSIHGIFQARVLEWVAISFSRGFSWPRDWTHVSLITGRCFTIWATREAQSESEVSQSCPTLCDPMDCSLPGSSIHGIVQASVLEWVAISFSRGSSRPRDWIQVSCIAGRCFTIWATREARQSKTQFVPQPVPLIRKLLQASYPYPRRQTEWKPQSQKINQTDHMDHSLV